MQKYAYKNMRDLTETKFVQLWLPVENNLWTMKRKHVEPDDTDDEEGKDLGGKTQKWSVLYETSKKW